MHLCVDYFVTVDRADYHGSIQRCSDFRFTFVHVEQPKSSRQVVFSLFLKVHNKSCHPQKEKYEDADASNQPVNIDLNGRSVCEWAPDDTRTCTFHV